MTHSLKHSAAFGRLMAFIATAFCCMALAAQSPVKCSISIDSISPTQGAVVAQLEIDNEYHVYGPVLPASLSDTPPTQLTVATTEGVTLGEVSYSKEPASHFDNLLNAEILWWEGSITLTQPFTVSAPGAWLNAKVSYMACNSNSCTPPTEVEQVLSFGNTAGIENPYAEEDLPVMAQPAAQGSNSLWWEPVDESFNSAVSSSSSDTSWYGLLLAGFLGGLLALLTPCVWPMIPMTVSFFLKANKGGKKGHTSSKAIFNSSIYGLSIVVIFVLLGLVVTMAFGASKLNELSTSPVFNIIFFLLLVVFAISFFGAFDIKLPASWSNYIDSKAESTTGILSIFFMAFTLVLVSFSCTGPIIGTLLVEAATNSNIVGPLIGMLGFSLGLALPFTLFSIFPALLSGMPKSGGWLNSVKVVLGFIELILSLKFLSVADLTCGWRILDREVFISLWIVLFILLGLYLLGKLRFSHDSEQKHTSVLGFFLATVSFAFAVYMLPGLWGAPLKSISAFAPPAFTQDFDLYSKGIVEFDDYDEGMRYAKEKGLPVFVDFTGYGCVNCRKMELAVFDKPEVHSLFENDFVIIRLYVDDKAPLEQPYVVEQNGIQKKIKTVGDRWSDLQIQKFKTSSQPYYVILDNDGKPLVEPRVYDEDVPQFVDWLNRASSEYKKH